MELENRLVSVEKSDEFLDNVEQQNQEVKRMETFFNLIRHKTQFFNTFKFNENGFPKQKECDCLTRIKYHDNECSHARYYIWLPFELRKTAFLKHRQETFFVEYLIVLLKQIYCPVFNCNNMAENNSMFCVWHKGKFNYQEPEHKLQVTQSKELFDKFVLYSLNKNISSLVQEGRIINIKDVDDIICSYIV